MSDKVICNCIGVTEDDIIEAVQMGAETLEEVQEQTEAGTVCSVCIEEIEEIIEANK